MNSIKILPEKVASQIAAGEVIERPASIVRELIDNSIDAGADGISIQIDQGGKLLIQVKDNGVGMSRDDLLLCVERHATSKINSTSDLFFVKSLGFRGEALPSIASVSKIDITSRLSEQIEGHRLKIAGGKLLSIEETGAPPGTNIEVKALFYNLPARRKFLRTPKTETDHIIDIVTRKALPFQKIYFRLEQKGKTILDLPSSGERLPRLSSVMGRRVAKSMKELHETTDGMEIHAFVAPSEFNRNRGDRLFVYVNGRNVRDRLLTKAIMEGYGQRLMKGQYPQAVIFLDIDPSMIDVNVHPTKEEIRFRQSRMVFQLVTSTIERGFVSNTRVFSDAGSLTGENRDGPNRGSPVVSDPPWEYMGGEPWTGVEGTGPENTPPIVKEGPQIIGQLGNTYILCQEKDGLLLIDQHAAHERIVYEDLKKSFLKSNLEVQNLLIPRQIELTIRETRIAIENREQLSKIGIELDHFGGNSFILRSVPSILEEVDWDSFLSELLPELEKGEIKLDTIMENVLTVMACHGAVRAGHRLSHEESVHLMHQLEEMDLPTNCPHGRPVLKRFTYNEIEKMFKRVV